MSHSYLFAVRPAATGKSTICNRLRLLIAAFLLVNMPGYAAWLPGTHFEIREHQGQQQLFDPNGNPFKSVGMVWDYGPHRGARAAELTPERVFETLRLLKELGFNTLNLYGDQFMPEMLDWCDENEVAVYLRTDHHQEDLREGDMAEYPDYMDPAFRAKAKAYYDTKYLGVIKNHPSVLAIDMDHDWLFPLDWSSTVRVDEPKIRRYGRDFFPRWLSIRYGTIEKMNREFGTDYTSFDAVLDDEALVRNSQFRPLGNHPLRVPIYEYTIWTSQDFMSELASYMKLQLPGLLITPTTEHPEVIPDFNPPPSTGVDFMSPVHYNLKADYQRDQAALCKLIYETRWTYDMQGAPVYISETGWRTEVLEQEPPSIGYAWSEPADEDVVARLYAEQFTLLNLLPWISGYGYFKLYDKWEEGDFGYLRDDGSKKPMAKVGDVINGAFPNEALSDPEPILWIYYPDYAKATHTPGYQQLKTLIYLLEKPFLDALDQRIDENWAALSAGDKSIAEPFVAGITADFKKLWRGFAFANSLPEDDKPIVLLSSVSEILSQADRARLKEKKTITFGPVGVRDLAMRPTEPWNYKPVGLYPDKVKERLEFFDFDKKRLHALDEGTANGVDALTAAMADYDGKPITCEGQDIHLRTTAKRALFVASSSEGNATLPITVNYKDGEKQSLLLGPTISDGRYAPTLTPAMEHEGTFLSVVESQLDGGKMIESITLPVAPWVQLHAALFVSGGEELDAPIKLGGKEGEVEGRTAWRVDYPTKSGRIGSHKQIRVIDRTPERSPAVIASGKHVAYLFDPLTWRGGQDEISRHVDYHARIFNEVLEYLDGR